MGIHSNILAWRIPWILVVYIVHRVAKSQTQLTRLHTHTGTSLVVQWLRIHDQPDAGDLGSVPGQGTRSRVPQLRICLLLLRPGAVK